MKIRFDAQYQHKRNIYGNKILYPSFKKITKSTRHEHLSSIKYGNTDIVNKSYTLHDQETKWFQNHVGYTMAKYGMSMCVLGMSEELKKYNIAVNALWPRTAIATSAVKNLLGGESSVQTSRYFIKENPLKYITFY